MFVAGLLLDLSAVYFRGWEMKVFYRHLVRNRDWLGRLIADHKGYCEADYEEFEHQLGKSSLAKDTEPGHGVPSPRQSEAGGLCDLCDLCGFLRPSGAQL